MTATSCDAAPSNWNPDVPRTVEIANCFKRKNTFGPRRRYGKSPQILALRWDTNTEEHGISQALVGVQLSCKCLEFLNTSSLSGPPLDQRLSKSRRSAKNQFPSQFSPDCFAKSSQPSIDA